jgi:quercetin dioxygenase-like cupin family protein
MGCCNKLTDRFRGMPVASVVALGSLVSPQEGSVVSRELLKTPGGTVTVFSFATGQGLSTHSAPFDALVTVLEGQGHFTVGGDELEVAAGQSLLMPADIPHALKANQPFKMLLVMVK